MIKFVVFIISLFLSFTFYQYKLEKIYISLDRMNVIYIGVDNPISISTKIPVEELSITMRNGIVKYVSDYKFVLQPEKPGTSELIISSKDTVLAKYIYRSKRVPNPIPTINNSKGGEISLEDIKNSYGLTMLLENFDFDAQCKAANYQVILIKSNGKRESIKNEGAKFADEVIALIQNIESGDILVFDNIEAICVKEEKNRKIGNLALFIK